MSRLTGKNESICDYCEYERNNGCIKTDPAKCVFNRAWNELQHYKDLEEQGRLIELPCKVGTTLYFIGKRTDGTEIIDSTEIFTIDQCLNLGQHIGHGFYLTKEEAEAKLQELRGVHNDL